MNKSYPVLLIIILSFFIFKNNALATPIRGAPNDLWADVIIGQDDFNSGINWTTSPDKAYLPNGIIIDRSKTPNKLYVWDGGNSRILGFNLDKCLTKDPSTRCAADIIIGQPDGFHSSCNGDSNFQNHPERAPASKNSLCGIEEVEKSPGEGGSSVSMAVDKDGNLYVPDFHNNRVLKYNNPFETDTEADEVWGQDNFSGNLQNKGRSSPDNTTLNFEPFGNEVSGVEIDEEGYLWVADTKNNRILRFPPGEKTANLVLGQSNFNSNSQGSNLNSLYAPAVARVKGNGSSKKVYVADYRNNRILVYQAPFTNGMPGKIWGSGFNNPSDLQFDLSGLGIWVNDPREAGKGFIEFWNNEGTQILKFIGGTKYVPYTPGTPDYNNLSNGYFMENYGSLGLDSKGNICTATRWGHEGRNNNVLCYLAPFQNGGLAKNPDVGFFNPPAGGNLVTKNEIGSARSLTISDNQLILIDLGRILYWNNPETLANGQTPNGVINYDQDNNFPVSETVNSFSVRENIWDTTLTSDKSHHLYIFNNNWGRTPEILVYNLPLKNNDTLLQKIVFPIPFLGGGSFLPSGNLEVGGIAATPDGKYLWLTESDASRIVRIRNPLDNPIVDVVLGQDNINEKRCNKGLYQCDGHWCSPPYNDPSKTTSSLCLPGLLSLDKFGNLYVSDNSIETRGNKRLMIFNANLFPDNNPQILTGISASKIIDRIEPSQTAFNSQNQMVVGFNPFLNLYSGVNLGNCPKTPTIGSCNFPAVYLDILNQDSGSLPDAYLKDFYTHPFTMVFDDKDNLYVGDMNRPRVLIYYKPFGNLPTPPKSPSIIPCPNGEKGNLDCDPEGKINETDISIFLNSWAPNGPVPTPASGKRSADLDGNGKVDEIDFNIILRNWNP